MEAADLLEARKLKKHFGRVKAVDGLDFSLKRGRTLAVVGEFGLWEDDDREAHPSIGGAQFGPGSG